MLNKQQTEYTKTALGDRVVPIHEAVDPNRSTKEAYPTGWPLIDNATAKNGRLGFKDGDLLVVSGKSGHGKTLFALNLISHFLDNGIPSVLFSYEVVIDNVYDTFVEMGREEQPLIYTPQKHITGDIGWIKEKILEADKKYFTKVAVIDHLDFVTAKNIKTDDHRRNEINNIVTDLKNFAVEEKKIIVLLAHVIKTKDKQLANEDIADSRAMANLADYIFFVGREIDGSGDPVGNNGILKITKNRYTGQHVKMRFYVSDSQIIQSDDQSFTD